MQFPVVYLCANKTHLLIVKGYMKFSFNRLVTQGLKTWERHPASAWVLSILWLLLISFLAFFWNLGSTGLIDETEPLFAEAARQMTVTGDWITPFFNGATRFDKPPLIYWLMAIAYQTFGVNEFAARLPSALTGLALTAMVFYTLRDFGSPSGDWGQGRGGEGEKVLLNCETNQQPNHLLTKAPVIPSSQWQSWLVACLGAAMVALHPQTLFFGRTGYSDMLLSACMGGALLTFFLGYAQPERGTVQARWYLTFYILIALAVLTKGPVGVVLPGLIIGAFLLYVGKAREVLGEMRLVRGALIVLALSLPWFILVIWRNGEAYIDSFFGYHNLERFTSVVNDHQGPWYFHLLIVLIGFAPWSIGLPAAISFAGIPWAIAQSKVFQRRNWQQLPRKAHLGLFALFWFLIVLGFFSLAVTKYFSYTLPLMPAAAILLALWWSHKIVQGEIFHQHNGDLKLTSLVSIILFLVLAIACFLCPQWLGDDPSMPNLGLRISQAGLSVIGAVIWGVSAIAGTVLLLRRQTHWFWGVKFLGFVAFLIFVIMPASGIIDSERQLPLRQIAQSVVQVQAPGEKLLMIANGFEKPSLVFYTQRTVTFLHRPSEAASYLKNVDKQARAESLLLIATPKSLKKTGLAPNQYQEITQAGIYQLVRVSRVKVL
jgi:4-amino-4-deoxy-L-arabinose transferase-like glycosyltransferase